MKNVANLFPPSVTENTYAYSDYMLLMEKMVQEKRTTGPKQSEELNYYTRLNLARMQRLNKTVLVNEDLKNLTDQIDVPQTWYILTEAWCGDASQSIPVIVATAQSNELITIKLLLRDENLPLMDEYLTFGGRSIPKLIAVDENHNELFTWGPRPAGAQQLLVAYKAGPGKPYKEFAEDIQRWYNADKTQSIQNELKTILEGVLIER